MYSSPANTNPGEVVTRSFHARHRTPASHRVWLALCAVTLALLGTSCTGTLFGEPTTECLRKSNSGFWLLTSGFRIPLLFSGISRAQPLPGSFLSRNSLGDAL